MRRNITIDKKAFEEYQESEKKKTIWILKVIIIFLLISNICFVYFLIIFQINISKNVSYNKNTLIETEGLKDSNQQQENKIQNMLVNIFSSINPSFNSLTDIIRSKKEYEQIMSYTGSKKQSFICYQGTLDGDNNYEAYHQYCGFFPEQIILLELNDGHRFGAYLSKIPEELGKDDLHIDDPNAFLFNVDTGEIYKVNDPRNVITIFKNGFFKIGNYDLYISNNYMSNEKSYSRFPNQFGSNDISKNVLTNGKENLSIVQMEIFSLWTKSSEE
jgi:hypothetical protein